MAVAHVHELAARIERQCCDAGLARPAEAAAELMLVVEGAIVRAQMAGADAAMAPLRGLFARVLAD